MSSAHLRIRFANVTLDQLIDELGKFRFAGWGSAELEFNTSSLPSVVEVKMYRAIPKPAAKGAPK